MKTNLMVQYKVRQLISTKPFDFHGVMKFSFFSGILMVTSGGGGDTDKNVRNQIKTTTRFARKNLILCSRLNTRLQRQGKNGTLCPLVWRVPCRLFFSITFMLMKKWVTLRRCPRATDRPFRSVVFGQAARERLGPRRTAPGDAGSFWWRIFVLNCPWWRELRMEQLHTSIQRRMIEK